MWYSVIIHKIPRLRMWATISAKNQRLLGLPPSSEVKTPEILLHMYPHAMQQRKWGILKEYPEVSCSSWNSIRMDRSVNDYTLFKPKSEPVLIIPKWNLLYLAWRKRPDQSSFVGAYPPLFALTRSRHRQHMQWRWKNKCTHTYGQYSRGAYPMKVGALAT